MSRVCVVYSKVRSGGYSGQCNNRRGATAMHKDGSCRRTKTPTFAGARRFPCAASQMRDEALALPLGDRRADRSYHNRAHNTDAPRRLCQTRPRHAMPATAPPHAKQPLLLLRNSRSRQPPRRGQRNARRTADGRCGGRHPVRHANVMCATPRAPATSAGAARTSETPKNWIGARLARASRLPLTGT